MCKQFHTSITVAVFCLYNKRIQQIFYTRELILFALWVVYAYAVFPAEIRVLFENVIGLGLALMMECHIRVVEFIDFLLHFPVGFVSRLQHHYRLIATSRLVYII